MEAIKNRILTNWRVAKRAETKERIALALDTFIDELANFPLSPQASDVGIRAIRLLVDLACADFEQHKTENRFFEDLNRILRLCGYRLLRAENDRYQVVDAEKWDLTIHKTSSIWGIAEFLRSQSPKL
ncbi:hypothetical protein [Fischerella sp. PCC 9605]|uniref:hypothetical protein n=1 Tax=Fischerella sp. PCC 9605 TaxID=1173024 RepID=UPI00047C289E|nr:hypothetical protein [Fischerella sp. PCC 9605]